MRASIVQIGNSRGVRIPKVLLEQTGLQDEVEIEVRGEQLIIRPANHPRAGWGEAFARMAERGDDSMLDPVCSGPPQWLETVQSASGRC